MRAFLSACLLLLFAAGALAQNKTPGNIGIWSDTPAPNSLTDTGAANAPGNFTVSGNLNVTGNLSVTGTANSVPGVGAQAFIPIENWGVLPTNTPATNATRIATALNEASQKGAAVVLSQIYPTTAIAVSAACPAIVGTSPRVGFRFDTVVTTGLSITCPLVARNLLMPAPFVRLSNFALITTVAGGGTALSVTMNSAGGGDNLWGPQHTQMPSLQMDRMLISGDNNWCGGTVTPSSCSENPPIGHYWSDGVRGTNLSAARFENNTIYGTAMPYGAGAAGTAATFQMQNGFYLTGNQGGCDTPQFFHNDIQGVHWAIRSKMPSGRACEGWWVKNNNLIRNDYGVYLEGITNDYHMPQYWVSENSIETQFEGIWAHSLQELHVVDNVIYNRWFPDGQILTSNCIYIGRADHFYITNNICSLIGTQGVGSTGILANGPNTNRMAQYGIISGNFFKNYEGGVHLGSNSREIYSELNVNWGPDGRPISIVPNEYHYKDDAPGGGAVNRLGIRCGAGVTPATGSNAYGIEQTWQAGLRQTAC